MNRNYEFPKFRVTETSIGKRTEHSQNYREERGGLGSYINKKQF